MGSGGRGQKSGHKGQRRHFSNPDELDAKKEKELREKEWRKARGQDDSDSDEDKEKGSGDSSSESESSSSEDEGAEAVVAGKAKGVEGMIEIENPNRVVQKAKKMSELDNLGDAKPELSRREREEIEKQQARANYLRLHAAGKTEDAQADLARLAIIRKQREDAAKKREDDKKAKEAAAKAKTESTNKALGKKKT